MTTEMKLLDIFKNKDDHVPPFSGAYKIPWNDPEFSRRMLTEHPSQDHDLASRKLQTVGQHVRWLHDNLLNGAPGRFLDLGCGPGLYSNRLAKLGHTCFGTGFY